jgi:hypothetical protein
MDEEHVVTAKYEEPKKESSNKGLVAIIFVLLLMLVGGGAYVFGTKQTNNFNEPTSTPTEEISPTEVLGSESEISATPSVTQKISSVLVSVNPENATACPTTFEFAGAIKADNPGVVKYRWIKSDGSVATEEQTEFIIAGTKTVNTSWKVFGGYTGWMRLEVLSPTVLSSNTAQFKLTCTTPTPTLNLKPLLTPSIKLQLLPTATP